MDDSEVGAVKRYWTRVDFVFLRRRTRSGGETNAASSVAVVSMGPPLGGGVPKEDTKSEEAGGEVDSVEDVFGRRKRANAPPCLDENLTSSS